MSIKKITLTIVVTLLVISGLLMIRPVESSGSGESSSSQKSSGPTLSGLNDCIGPTELVKVKIREQSKNPSIYYYEVTNLYKSPIKYFILGDSDHPEMHGRPNSNPLVKESPKGWKGDFGYIYESNYVRVSWMISDEQFLIKLGETLGGFLVEVPPFPKEWEGKFNNDGLPVVPLNMKQVPFKVHFDDFTCVWGRPIEN